MKIIKWPNTWVETTNLWQPGIIAKKVWAFLGQIRFLSKEDSISNKGLKILLQTREELLSEIQKSWSNNLLEVIKKPEQEIMNLLKNMLTNQNEKERKKLTDICMRWDFLTEEEKQTQLENIKEILNDLNHFSEHIKDKDIQERINFFNKRLKLLQ